MSWSFRAAQWQDNQQVDIIPAICVLGDGHIEIIQKKVATPKWKLADELANKLNWNPWAWDIFNAAEVNTFSLFQICYCPSQHLTPCKHVTCHSTDILAIRTWSTWVKKLFKITLNLTEVRSKWILQILKEVLWNTDERVSIQETLFKNHSSYAGNPRTASKAATGAGKRTSTTLKKGCFIGTIIYFQSIGSPQLTTVMEPTYHGHKLWWW